MEDQEIVFWGTYNKIVETSEATCMDEAVQKEVDDTTSAARQGA